MELHAQNRGKMFRQNQRHFHVPFKASTKPKMTTCLSRQEVLSSYRRYIIRHNRSSAKKKKKTEKEKRRRTESRSTSSQIMISGDHLRTNYYLNVLVSWCFELSQPQRITSGLNKKLHSISKLFVSQIVIPQVMFFEPIYIPRALNTGTCINRLWKRAGWPILFRGSTQELELARANVGKTRERFYKKWRWMDRKGGS